MEAIPFLLAGTKVLGTVVSGAEEAQNLKAQQRAAQLSASYARQDATNELRIATSDAEMQRRRGREVIAEQTTAMAQSGLSDTTGRIIEISAAEAELDALKIQYKGTLRNRAGLIEAGNYDNAADAAKRARKVLPYKVAIGAATQALSGAMGPQYNSSTGARIS